MFCLKNFKSTKNLLFDANIKLTYPYNKVFNPVNLVFLFLSIQFIRLTTYCHICVKQLMADFNLFQSHLISQNGNNTVEYTALTYVFTIFGC